MRFRKALFVTAWVFLPAVSVRAVDVTFAVDMSVQIDPSANFDPVTDGVYVRGTFNTWACSTDWELFDDGMNGDAVAGDEIYSKTFDLTAGSYLFKFNMNCVPDGDDGRWELPGQPDRAFSVDADPEIESHFFSDIESIVKLRVNFEVDMNVFLDCGDFDPTTESINARGGFNDWGCEALEDPEADGFYSGSVDLDNVALGNQEYKFNIGCVDPGYELFGFPNRAFNVHLGLPEVAGDPGRLEVSVSDVYDNKTADGEQYEIHYSVNMGVQIAAGNFDPLLDQVLLRGNANNWGCNTVLTPNVDNDEIYEGLVNADCVVAEFLEHKFSTGCEDTLYELPGAARFVSITGEEPDVDENGRREIVVDTVFWANVTEILPTHDIELVFAADMTVQIALDNFDPVIGETVNARGLFNAWGCKQLVDPDMDGVYESSAPVQLMGVDEGTYPYKFNKNCDDGLYETFSPDAMYTVDDTLVDSDENGFKEVVLSRFWDNQTADDVLVAPITAIFTVDISSALAALDAGQTITPLGGGTPITSREEVTGVALNGPLYDWNSWGNLAPAQFAFDDGTNFDEVAGDNIYTLAFPFQAGDAADQVYKWSLNGVDNEAGFDENHSANLINDCVSEGGAAGGSDSQCVLPTDCFGENNTDQSLPFGSGPGAEDCPPPAAGFKRGDGDASGTLNINDPIFNLIFQFLGGVNPVCKDALDTDDSGTVTINDPIISLTFQFLGGVTIPLPGPDDCGPDPTNDNEACAAYPQDKCN